MGHICICPISFSPKICLISIGFFCPHSKVLFQINLSLVVARPSVEIHHGGGGAVVQQVSKPDQAAGLRVKVGGVNELKMAERERGRMSQLALQRRPRGRPRAVLLRKSLGRVKVQPAWNGCRGLHHASVTDVCF